MSRFNIKVTDQDGNERTVGVSEGDDLASVTPSGCTAMLEGREASPETTLRANDHVELVAKSPKAG